LDRAFTAAVNLEPEVTARTAVRGVADRYYVEFLGPLLLAARDRGELRADADLEVFQAWLVLILPHLALATHGPGLDPILDPMLGLTGADPVAVRESVHRLLAPLEAAFGAPGAPAKRAVTGARRVRSTAK